jgi:hypothetical protein
MNHALVRQSQLRHTGGEYKVLAAADDSTFRCRPRRSQKNEKRDSTVVMLRPSPPLPVSPMRLPAHRAAGRRAMLSTPRFAMHALVQANAFVYVCGNGACANLQPTLPPLRPPPLRPRMG